MVKMRGRFGSDKWVRDAAQNEEGHDISAGMSDRQFFDWLDKEGHDDFRGQPSYPIEELP